MSEPEDLQLIHAALQGSPSAFDALVRRYQERLVHSLDHVLGSRDDALDVAQQAFTLAWRKLSTFRGQSGFYSWLYRIARNVASSLKRRHHIQAGSLDQLNEASGFEPTDQQRVAAPESHLERAEKIESVQHALRQIPEEFRQPLVLREMDDFSYEQIAEILEIPVGTVRSRIFRARQILIDKLTRLEDQADS